MKIVQIISTNQISGASSVVTLSRGLLSLGHDVVAICPAGGWLPGILSDAQVPAATLPMRGAASPLAAPRLARLLRAYQADILHAHLSRASAIGYAASRLTGIPMVSTIHVAQRSLASRLMARSGCRLVAVSAELREQLLRSGVPPQQVETVYNGTEFGSRPDQEKFWAAEARAELGIRPQARVAGLVGSISDFKGARLLIDAAAQVAATCPDAHFLLVGPGEPDYVEGLRGAVRGLGLEERIHFTGRRTDVERLVCAMDIVTLPSEFEGCSMAVVEAMALGKPVVVTRVGGNPEIVRDGVSGFLIERSSSALASTLLRLFQNTDERARMGAAARNECAQRFQARVVAQEMLQVYRRSLSSRRFGAERVSGDSPRPA